MIIEALEASQGFSCLGTVMIELIVLVVLVVLVLLLFFLT